MALTEGAGSGIIVGQNDEELLIVSNYHVVKNANELTVTFVDNSEAQAEVKGQDADKDLAVITVQLDSLSDTTKNAITIAKLGDSDALTLHATHSASVSTPFNSGFRAKNTRKRLASGGCVTCNYCLNEIYT